MLGTGYNACGWLNQVQTTPSGGSPFTLATVIGYTGNAGAAMQPTSASIANGTYTYTASFDADLRLTTDSLTTANATLYSATRGYDAVGNVVSEDTQLGASTTTDNQLFCYNAQNQLTWAGATGTSPCNGAVSSGTLTSAHYTQAYSYDAQGRLSSAALGSYTYGDAAHPHAVTAIGSGAYGASYDAAGDMTCRAPNSSVTCAGAPTGATLTYDAERRLAHWQNTPTTPTVQDDYLYDGEGQRVEQYVNTSGTITSTAYLLDGIEEVSGGVVTKYLGAKGLPTAVRVGTAGALNYLATDGLGSVSVAVDGSGNVVAAQLYDPYGNVRYSSGTMPTSKGFTGQRADAASGLDYYGARYYDPVAGQFVSADSAMNGLSRYAYVGGNPETATDPSGHLRTCWNCNGNGSGPSDGGGSGTSGCTNGANCGCYTSCGNLPTTQSPPGTGTPGTKPCTTCGNASGTGGASTTSASSDCHDPQCEIKENAQTTADIYNILSKALGVLGLALAGVAALLALASIGVDILSVITGGAALPAGLTAAGLTAIDLAITFEIGVLAIEASQLGSLFQQEADYSGTYTTQYVEGLGQEVSVGVSLLAGGFAYLASLVSQATNDGSPGVQAAQDIVTTSFGIAAGAVLAVGAIGLVAISLQEQDIEGPPGAQV